MVIWIPLLWIAAGICLFAGVHFLTIGRSKDHAYLFAVFGAMSLAVGVYIGISAWLQTPGLHTPWLQIERIHMAVVCVVFPLGIWFIALYSRLRRYRAWVIAGAVIFSATLVANFTGAGSVLLASVHDAPDLILPWGEHIRQVVPIAAPTALAYDVATLMVFIWSFWRCWALVRQGDRGRANALAAYLCVQFIASVYSEYVSANDVQGRSGLEWSALPFLLLVVVVSRTLSHELRRNAAALDSTVSALHAENAQRALAEARLRRMAYTDAISTLPNRAALDEWLARRFASTPPPRGALAVIDPRRFAIVNRVLGHHGGDLVIQEIGERLARALGDAGYVARLHGDEFAVVWLAPAGADASEPRLLELATRWRTALAEPSQAAAHAPPIDVHIGLVALDASADADTLVRHAYAALHAAKEHPCGEPELFSQPVEQAAARRLRLEADLHNAIDQHQLYLEYQPQVDHAGTLVGAEALLRWAHPEYGAVAPGEFVPIAEASGQMPALVRFVLREACAALRTLPSHVPFRLAVNVSPQQVFMPDFVETVRSAMAAADVDPHGLTLEITESALIRDASGAVAQMNALNQLGVHLSVDDFGTGYASIARLKSFPVHELKIDQSFVDDMTTAQPDRFIAAILALARALNLRVVAEGVEHEAQLAALVQAGCAAFQGYLIGHPAPLSALAGRLASVRSAGSTPSAP